MDYPRIYLVLDSCFAIKRWIRPQEWMKIARDIGFQYVQASTDNEIDPLFCSDDYMDDWFEEVVAQQNNLDMRLVNFYTGYQTYRTVGLAHYDERIRKRITEEWIKKLIVKIAAMGAKGLGFSFFAIPHAVLQEAAAYREMMDMICGQMSDIAAFAYDHGKVQVSVEQMYAPQQPPFTIEGTRDFLNRVYEENKRPCYVTIDVGHMVGQRKFLLPSKNQIESAWENNRGVWLGSDKAQDLFEEGRTLESTERERLIEKIQADIFMHDYLFSKPEDSDVYKWIETVGCYSPIIHMQQTDGLTSSHAAFTPETNKNGIIKGDRILKALKNSYDANPGLLQQEMSKDIYLSFEIFGSNIETGREIIKKLEQSIKYFRQWVPKDGMRLDKLV